jgi:hypothetical protein
MRRDLLSLGAESLARLANVGLVKRAQREVESGAGPTIEETADGTVVALSRDKATTRLARDTPLKDSYCSCGSSAVCRHRIAAVLAYQRDHAGDAEALAEPWNPGDISDEALARVCGDASLQRARAALQRSLLANTQPGAVPVVALPASTVQFLVRDDLAFAKCDCARGHRCEHVVVAVWAFRRQPQGGLVEMGTVADAGRSELLANLDATLRELVRRGVADLGVPEMLREARARAERAGWVWIADGLEDLERQREAYDRQSAVFATDACALLVGELTARLRAAARSSALLQGVVLGADEAKVTEIEQVRLTALGAELFADGERRTADLYFAERDTRQVFLLRKQWTFAPGERPRNGHELGDMFASSRLSLSALARGELVTRAARRRANGVLDLAAARGMKTALLPPSMAWSELPEPILVRDVRGHERAAAAAPPGLLRPRRLGDGVRVLCIGKVLDVGYRAAEQLLVADVEDMAGTRVRIERSHRAVAAGAIDALARALRDEPRFVSGRLRRSTRGWVLTPFAVVGERVTVPDLEKPAPGVALHGAPAEAPDDLDTVLAELASLVDRGVLKGSRALQAAGPALAARLRDAGMGRTAALLEGTAAEEERLLDLAVVRALLHEPPHIEAPPG